MSATLDGQEEAPPTDRTATATSLPGNARQRWGHLANRYGAVHVTARAGDAPLVVWKDSPSGWQCWSRPSASNEFFEQQLPLVAHIEATAREWLCAHCGELSGEQPLSDFEDDHLFCRKEP